MFLKLILNNWKARPGKFSIVFAAICLSLTLITLLNSLNAGVKNYFLNESDKEKILRELNVKPQGNKLELSLASLIPQAKLTAHTLDQIGQIPEVEEVLPSNTIQGISSLQIGILGQWFQTDALLYGAPYELLDIPELSPQQWSNNIDEPFPAVVSSKLIDLYNFSFANANNLPQFTKENFLGSEVIILLNQSTFFGSNTSDIKTLRAKIVGFSPNVKLIGLTLPLETINRINKIHLNKSDQFFLDATVYVKSPTDLSLVQEKLRHLGLEVTTAETSLKSLEGIFTVTDISLNFFFLIMTVLTGLLISSTFLAKITEKSKEIAILKTLGLTSQKISFLYLLEAILIGFLATITGISLAVILIPSLEFLLKQSIKTLLNKPEQFFLIEFHTILQLISFTVFLSALFAYLPAKKAAKLDPVKLLTK